MNEREHMIGKAMEEKIQRQQERRGKAKVKGKFELDGRERRIKEAEIIKWKEKVNCDTNGQNADIFPDK